MKRIIIREIACSGLFLLFLLCCSPAKAQLKRTGLPVPVTPVKGPILTVVKRPDTLNMGNFLLIVDAYEAAGSWNAQTLTFEHLSGIGRIRFGCQPPQIIIGKAPLLKNQAIRNIDLVLVDTVTQPDREISVQQAIRAGIPGSSGDQLTLTVPVSAINTHLNLGQLIHQGFTLGSPGVKVRFSNISAQVHAANASLGTVKAGMAAYPDTTGIGPFTLNISPGFQLEVSAFTIHAGKDAEASATLLLPASLSAATSCLSGRLGLGVISLSNACQFYKVLPDSLFGPFGVGNTTLSIQGKGYVADFSTTQGYSAVSEPLTWKGVVLLGGTSPGSPGDSVLSNTGFLQGDYGFTNGLVEQNGLSSIFKLQAPYSYNTLQPMGYRLSFDTATIDVASSAVKIGVIRGADIRLPNRAAVALNDSAIELVKGILAFGPTLDLVGKAAVRPGASLWWGDLVKAGGGIQKSYGVTGFDSAALLYFSATPKALAFPVSAYAGSLFDSVHAMTLEKLDSLGMQGVTFTGFRSLFINSPQSPGTYDPDHSLKSIDSSHLALILAYQPSLWLNVGGTGVQCNIHTYVTKTDSLYLGNPSENLYSGVTPFTLTPAFGLENTATFVRTHFDFILLQCIESAVVLSDFKATLAERAPTGGLYQVAGMVFTSTGNIAGGQISIGLNDSLSYWGLRLVPKPGFTSAGVVSVRTGQIILTASGLSESRHFAQPFWLTWGEMLADGSVGRLFFDYNSANQQFDQFNFVPAAVALSPYSAGSANPPYLHVGGTIHFPFFGGTYLNIEDQYIPTDSTDPFDRRLIVLQDHASQGMAATNRHIAGNWLDGLGIFRFLIGYDSITQNGFLGGGTSALRYLNGGAVGSTIVLNGRMSCIHIGTNLSEIRAVSLGPVANISNMTQLWGCACIMGDDIENVVVGGSITNAANASIAVRSGSYLSAILQITPSMARLTLDGEASLSLLASMDAEINGHMQLTLNEAQGSVEGELSGTISMAVGALFAGSSLTATGQLDWHLGLDYESIQGDVTLSIMSTAVPMLGSGTNLSAGFYLGQNAPTSDAWVLVGIDPHYGLNMSALPSTLTGFYGFLEFTKGVSLFVISGQYQLFVGLGAFLLEPSSATILGALASPGLPYFIGNLGGSISGSILGGLVSAGANFDLQLIAPYPGSFQGSVGLSACVAWVICASVNLTIGLNTSQGFYIN